MTVRRSLDVAAAVGLLVVALGVWVTQPAGVFTEALSGPFWAAPQDQFFDGPDAGHWGEQLIALRDGARDHLDPHRAPTWTLLSYLLLPLAGGVALAGHLANHGLYLLLGPLTYVLARQLRLGVVGSVCAALVTLLHPEIRRNQAVFSVDLTVYVAWVGVFVGAFSVRGRRGWAFAAGLVGAASFAAHFTTMPAAVGGALAVWVSAPAGRRWRTTGAFAVGLLAGLVIAYTIIPPISPAAFWNALYIGITNQERTHVDQGVLARVAAVLDTARRAALPAFLGWLDSQVAGRASGVATLALLTLGVLGPGLERRQERLGLIAAVLPRPLRLPGDALLRGAERSVPVLLMILPLPAFFVVSASPRYANLQLPLLFVLGLRGVVAVGALGEILLGRVAPRRAAGVLPAVLVGLATVDLLTAVRPWDRDDVPEGVLAHREAGTAIVARWGAGTQAVGWMKETTVYTDRVSCPRLTCPTGTQAHDLIACLHEIQTTCEGQGDTIPYVVMTSDLEFGRTPEGRLMDRWVLEHFPIVVETRAPRHLIQVAAVPRTGEP